jgi:hypothetical protein
MYNSCQGKISNPLLVGTPVDFILQACYT